MRGMGYRGSDMRGRDDEVVNEGKEMRGEDEVVGDKKG